MAQQTAVEFLLERYKANKLTDQDFEIARRLEYDDQQAHFDAGISEYDRLLGQNPKPNEFEKD